MAKPNKAVQAAIDEVRSYVDEKFDALRTEIFEVIEASDNRVKSLRETFKAHLPLLEQKITSVQNALAEISEKQDAQLEVNVQATDSSDAYGVTSTGKKYLLKEWTTTKFMQLYVGKRVL